MDDEHCKICKFGIQSQRFQTFRWPAAVVLFIFHISGQLHELDTAISSYRHTLSSLPRSAPTHASDVYYLARARLTRYLSTRQQDDLDQSILGFAEAILSLPLLRDTPDPFPNINEAFHSLTLAIFLRTNGSRRPEDVKYSVIYLRYLRGQQPEVYNDFSFPVTTYLVRVLAFQAQLELGDVDQDIEEMAVLCDDLLDELLTGNPDISTISNPVIDFMKTVDTRGTATLGVRIPSER